jgi:hypothetical protein
MSKSEKSGPGPVKDATKLMKNWETFVQVVKAPETLKEAQKILNDPFMSKSEKTQKISDLIEEKVPKPEVVELAYKIKNVGMTGANMGVNAYQNYNLAKADQQWAQIEADRQKPAMQLARDYRSASAETAAKQKELDQFRLEVQKYRAEMAAANRP